MPKLKNRPPKYSKLKNYAVVYLHGKTHYLGSYGSPDSRAAYARFVAESRINPFFCLSEEEKSQATVSELVATFLDQTKSTMDPTSFGHYKTLIGDFLLKLYGDDTPTDKFKPSCLKLVRSEMIQSRRFNRNTINKYVRRVVSLFEWGVAEELVHPNTANALKAVKFLKEGHAGTFEGKGKRVNVPDDIIKRTLPFMPPTIAAMVKLQRLTGCRPSEIFNMRVGDIERTRENGLWYYVPEHHKTERFIGEKSIPLGLPEQSILEPFLIDKKPDQAVFSPRQAVEERNTERKAHRKSKITPSQAARNATRAANPKQYAEFYTKHTYYRAVQYAIEKGNKILPEGQKIPNWYPYQLRHSASTATELAEGMDKSQALLGHKTTEQTRRYSHGQLKIREELARNRQNPFAKAEKEQ